MKLKHVKKVLGKYGPLNEHLEAVFENLKEAYVAVLKFQKAYQNEGGSATNPAADADDDMALIQIRNARQYAQRIEKELGKEYF